MRIERRNGGFPQSDHLRDELKEILTGGCNGRPVCGPACPRPEPRNCSRDCPEIPRALSGDPDNYPLEPRIAPLVFELKRLEVFHPCWSCEGHNHEDGTLWKIPRVWFYCQSLIHLRVLAGSLKQLRVDEMLSTPWQVVVTHSDTENSDTTFSLEPCLGSAPVRLAALQKDIGTISAHLHDVVFHEARKLSQAAG